MKVGLVHGRFQPFHNGHKFLVDQMLNECDLGVVLIGSVGKIDNKNPYDLETRKEMIRAVYERNKKLLIGANIDLDSPYSKTAQWDVVFSSCVLSLTGHLPTHVFVGPNYRVWWRRVRPKLRRFKKYNNISATSVRELIHRKKISSLEKLVPKEVFKIIKLKLNL